MHRQFLLFIFMITSAYVHSKGSSIQDLPEIAYPRSRILSAESPGDRWFFCINSPIQAIDPDRPEMI